MTEADWLASTDPQAMLAHVRGTISDRKLRLFGWACIQGMRFSWPPNWPPHPSLSDLLERVADGQTTQQDWDQTLPPDAAGWASGFARILFELVDIPRLAEVLTQLAGLSGEGRGQAERTRQADLLRELLGNPFRPVRFDPLWLAWDGGLIGKLARGIQEERAHERMPVLGDALEEAGCADRAVLDHCRQPQPHPLGCWVLDLLLGRG